VAVGVDSDGTGSRLRDPQIVDVVELRKPARLLLSQERRGHLLAAAHEPLYAQRDEIARMLSGLLRK
jgi:hypothetical protein